MKIYSLTDVGVKRKENQDNYWVSRLSVEGSEVGVLCMCDGMGGLDSGERASHIVVEAVRDYFKTSTDISGLCAVLKQKNAEIVDIAKAEGSTKGLGTTCTVAVLAEGTCRILHVGDSRLYKWSQNEGVRQLTTDHSALHKYGITLENNPELFKKYKNMLTRCIGIKPDIKIDLYVEPYKEGDKFMVCSDGFWHFFNPGDLASDLIQDLRSRVNECMQRGETDNITVAVLEV